MKGTDGRKERTPGSAAVYNPTFNYCPLCNARIIRGMLATGQPIDMEPHHEVYERLSERDQQTGRLVEPVTVAFNNYGYARHICLPTMPRHVALMAENERLKGEIRRMAERREAKEREAKEREAKEAERSESIGSGVEEHLGRGAR